MSYPSKKNRKVIGNFKIETPKKISIDEFVCLRSKMYAFKCGDDRKMKWKVFLKVNRKVLKLHKIKIVYLEGKINKNVIIIFSDQLTMKCIFKEWKNLHYLNLMINDVIKMKLK